jgi:hypothetical protein
MVKNLIFSIIGTAPTNTFIHSNNTTNKNHQSQQTKYRISKKKINQTACPNLKHWQHTTKTAYHY